MCTVCISAGIIIVTIAVDAVREGALEMKMRARERERELYLKCKIIIKRRLCGYLYADKILINKFYVLLFEILL